MKLTVKFKNLIYVICLFGLISCKTYCPDFDEKILKWVPYQENDVIELYSQLMDSTILFSIKSVEVEHTTHYSFGTDCDGCSSSVFISQNDDDIIEFQVGISLNANKINNQYFQIGDTHFASGSSTCSYSEIKKFSL